MIIALARLASQRGSPVHPGWRPWLPQAMLAHRASLLTLLDSGDWVDLPGGPGPVAKRADLPGYVVAVIEKAPGNAYRKRGRESLIVDVAGLAGEAYQLVARALEVCEVRIVGRDGKPRDLDVHVGDGGWVSRTSDDHVEVVVRLFPHVPDPRGDRDVPLFFCDAEWGRGQLRFRRGGRIDEKIRVRRSHGIVRRQ